MNRRLVGMLAVLVVVSAILLIRWRQQAKPGQPELKRAAAHAKVVEYLYALEARDRNGVSKLVPGDYDAAKEIDERLQQFGGARAAEAHINLTMDLSPDVLSANIQTVAPEGRELVWTENLFWREGAWWLVLGGRHSNRPSSGTQRPAP